MPVFSRRVRHLGVGLVACALGMGSALAEALQPLPEPLTLEYALSLADDSHPDLELARAGLAEAEAERLSADALLGVRVSAHGRLQWVEPSEIAADQSNADHLLSLILDKPLYDFGRSSAARAAGARELEGRELLFIDARQERRLLIMQRFFDVVLADLQSMRDNEEMAIFYVELDRLRDRYELGQVSDLQLLEQESLYQEVRRRRAESQNRQRATRALLAQALGRPGMLPSEVAPPQLPSLYAELPELEALEATALRQNPGLQALRARVAAARERVTVARAAGRPVLSGRLEAYAYERRLGSSDDYRAGLVLDVPLLTGGRVDALVATEQAKLDALQARYRQAELAVRQAVLDTWLRLDALRVQREEAGARRNYRELYLDRSRTLYDMEARADIGDAMVRMTEAQLAMAQTDFQMAMTWGRLRALSGELIGARLVPMPRPKPESSGEGEQAGT